MKSVKNRDDLSSEFSAVVSGFGSEATSLSKVCDAAYGKNTKDDIFPDADDGGSKAKYRRDIWIYCSTSGKVPTSLPNASVRTLSNNEESWGKHLQDKLVDVESNGGFWKIQQEEFGSIPGTDTFFTKRLNEASPPQKIKDICKAAYEMKKEDNASNDASKPTKNDILKYCSLARG